MEKIYNCIGKWPQFDGFATGMNVIEIPNSQRLLKYVSSDPNDWGSERCLGIDWYKMDFDTIDRGGLWWLWLRFVTLLIHCKL